MNLKTDHRDPFIIAQEKLARGQTLTEPEKLLLDKYAGDDNGTLNGDDITKMDAKRTDTAFNNSMGSFFDNALMTSAISPELRNFKSVGSIEISAAPPITPTFSTAATGSDMPDTDNTLTLGDKGPGLNNNPSMTLSLNNLAPRGPTGMG